MTLTFKNELLAFDGTGDRPMLCVTGSFKMIQALVTKYGGETTVTGSVLWWRLSNPGIYLSCWADDLSEGQLLSLIMKYGKVHKFEPNQVIEL